MHQLTNNFFFFLIIALPLYSFFFFFNDTATTEIYTLSLHDALPISEDPRRGERDDQQAVDDLHHQRRQPHTRKLDRKSTRLNSSHLGISYAVFCLKKKKKKLKERKKDKKQKNGSIKMQRNRGRQCEK